MKTRHDRPEEGIPSIVSLFSSGKNFLNFMVRLLVRKYMIEKGKNLREVQHYIWQDMVSDLE